MQISPKTDLCDFEGMILERFFLHYFCTVKNKEHDGEKNIIHEGDEKGNHMHRNMLPSEILRVNVIKSAKICQK